MLAQRRKEQWRYCESDLVQGVEENESVGRGIEAEVLEDGGFGARGKGGAECAIERYC